MRYLDTGERHSSHTLAQWFTDTLTHEVTEFRLQSGFFSLGAIELLRSFMQLHCAKNRPTSILVGSNEKATLRDDLAGLARLMGIPRPTANLGVIAFDGGFFHPKTYHVHREDGSQAAYVGSANLTPPGLAQHIEAGIVLDTRDGDDSRTLSDISRTIDSWFSTERPGLIRIKALQDIEEITAQGVLSITAPPRISRESGSNAADTSRRVLPRLRPMLALPVAAASNTNQGSIAQPEQNETHGTPEPVVTSTSTAISIFVTRNGFPSYLKFDPDAASPTSGPLAITGEQLPGRAVGLIIHLNRDSARYLAGTGKGTANISIPIATVSTLRFGTNGPGGSPRAEYVLRVRYVGDDVAIGGGAFQTNVQAYGYRPGESGHTDIRLVVPKGVSNLGQKVAEAGKPVPNVNSVALLEWPSMADLSFRLTFLDPDSRIARDAAARFQRAKSTGEIVGRRACWLPQTSTPTW